MKATTAYSLLVHRRPLQVIRLLDAIYTPENAYAIHIDARALEELGPPLRDWASGRTNVVLSKSLKCYPGAWSLVAAELQMAADLLKLSADWSHLINISGQDFPLVRQEVIRAFLDERPGISFMQKLDPYTVWPETVERRFKQLNLLLAGKVRYLPPLPRPAAPKVRWWGSSQWKILSREAVEYLLHDPFSVALRKGFAHAWASDEAYIPTVLFNSPLAEKIDPDYKRYIDWTGPVVPRTLTTSDYEGIVASGAFFARKFAEDIDDDVITMLEQRL